MPTNNTKKICEAIIAWYEDGNYDGFDPKLVYDILDRLNKKKKISNKQEDSIKNIFMNFKNIENYY